METVKIDGSNICYSYRDKDGVHMKIRKNTNDEIKSGYYRQIPVEDIPQECDLCIDIGDKSFVSFVKGLLSLADHREFLKILHNPIDSACWSVLQRKS